MTNEQAHKIYRLFQSMVWVCEACAWENAHQQVLGKVSLGDWPAGHALDCLAPLARACAAAAQGQ